MESKRAVFDLNVHVTAERSDWGRFCSAEVRELGAEAQRWRVPGFSGHAAQLHLWTAPLCCGPNTDTRTCTSRAVSP